MSGRPNGPASVLAKVVLAASLALLVWFETTGAPAGATAGAKSSQGTSTETAYRDPTQVESALGFDDLSFYDVKMKRVVEPGRFEVMVGGSSDNVKKVNLDVTAR